MSLVEFNRGYSFTICTRLQCVVLLLQVCWECSSRGRLEHTGLATRDKLCLGSTSDDNVFLLSGDKHNPHIFSLFSHFISRSGFSTNNPPLLLPLSYIVPFPSLAKTFCRIVNIQKQETFHAHRKIFILPNSSPFVVLITLGIVYFINFDCNFFFFNSQFKVLS